MRRFSNEYKESLVAKVLKEPKRSIRSVAAEGQVALSSLHKWVHDAQHSATITSSNIDHEAARKPNDWSSSKRFVAVINSLSLNNEELNEYCRKKGLYKNQLEQWKLDFMSDKELPPTSKKMASELKTLRDQNKRLQDELSRKEKALAEVAALLVLKKKRM